MKKNSLVRLVEMAAGNDEGAFLELYKKYYKSVYLAALKLCKSDADAQDIAQLTFIKVRRSIHSLQKPEYFPLWINRICNNEAKNFFRKNRDITFDDEYYSFQNQAIERRTDFVSDSYWHYRSDMQALATLLNELKPESKEILMLFYFQHRTYEEIANFLQLSEGTVKSRLFYARRELKYKIEEYEKRQNISLDFKAEAIGAAFVSAYAVKQASIIPEAGLIVYLRSFLNHVPKTVVAKVTVAGCLCASSVGAIAYARQVYQESHDEKQAVYSPVFNNENTTSFMPVSVDEYYIDNEVDAFYLLISWGFESEAFDKKSDEELLKMRPLYESIKQEDGQLYHVLLELGWASEYEKKIKL